MSISVFFVIVRPVSQRSCSSIGFPTEPGADPEICQVGHRQCGPQRPALKIYTQHKEHLTGFDPPFFQRFRDTPNFSNFAGFSGRPQGSRAQGNYSPSNPSPPPLPTPPPLLISASQSIRDMLKDCFSPGQTRHLCIHKHQRLSFSEKVSSF